MLHYTERAAAVADLSESIYYTIIIHTSLYRTRVQFTSRRASTNT